MLIEKLPSIHDVLPLEQGGPIARAGFLYQDHIAARLCIQMLSDLTLEEVWCETLDDVTLLWRLDGQLIVEFVQVKAADIMQMWSVALICDGAEKSLIGRSLAQHRCAEKCGFRIVSRIGLNAELRVLLLPAGSAARCLGNPEIHALHRKIGKQLDGVYSTAGWSPSNWLEHAIWNVAESEVAVEHSNLFQLETWLEALGEPLFSDQREELYNRILVRVMKASALLSGDSRKKLQCSEFRNWVMLEIERIKGHAPSKTGTNLTSKMKKARIPESAIQNALRLRLAYRQRMLEPKYQQEEGYKFAELELAATLNHLVAGLDAGVVTGNGQIFHHNCLNAVSSIQNKYGDVELSFLQGSMYSMADRCRHRFLPEEVS